MVCEGDERWVGIPITRPLLSIQAQKLCNKMPVDNASDFVVSKGKLIPI